MRFVGISEAKLDEKNRVAIPAKFRHEFGEGAAYLQASEDGCISMYTEATFEATAEEVKQAPRTTPEGRRAWRKVFMNTERVMPDSQGRVVIPARLLTRANISGPCDLVINGSDEWVEIWSVDAFEAAEGEA